MTDLEQQVVGLLIRNANGDSKLDSYEGADRVATYLEGGLSPEDASAFERALADDDPLRGAWFELVAAQAHRARSWTRVWLAAAVAALLLVGLGVALWARTGSDEAPAGDTVLARLAARADTVRRTRAPWLGELPSLQADAALPQRPDVYRGGLSLRTPRGSLLNGRPDFAWTPPIGARQSRLGVVSTDGAEVLRVDVATRTLRWPEERDPLAPGVYRWRVSTTTAFGTIEGGAQFRVLATDVAQRLESLLDWLRGTGDVDDRRLAVHIALDYELLQKAGELLERMDEDEHRDVLMRRLEASYPRSR